MSKINIFSLINKGDLDQVKILIENGLDINTRNTCEGKYTLLMTACNKNKIKIVEYLIEKGANVKLKDKDGNTAFFRACKYSNANIVKFFITKEMFDINAKDEYGYTPLNCSIIEKNNKVAKYLVSEGIYINIKNKDGRTPLIQACFTDEFELIKFLVEKGADINAKDNEGKTALEIAAKRFYSNLDIIKYLIKKGADIKNYKDTLLILSINRKDNEFFKYLLAKGANINFKSEGNTLLHYSSRSGDLNISKYLIEKGADVNARNSYESTPLHDSSRLGNFDTSEYLIEKGADVNAKNNKGEIPLMKAYQNDHIETVKLLIGKGADVNAKDNKGKTVLMFEIDFHYCCLFNNKIFKPEIVKLIIDNGADVNVKDKEGNTALVHACYRNNLDLAKLLIDNGADTSLVLKYPDSFSSFLIDQLKTYIKSKKPLNLPEDVTCFDAIEYCDVLVKDFVKSSENILIRIGDNINGYRRSEIIKYYDEKKRLYANEKLFDSLDILKLQNVEDLFFSSIDTGKNTFVLVPQTKEKFLS
jgi:ankyrin repeat protein